MTPRLILNTDDQPSLLAVTRFTVFASHTIGTGKRAKVQGVAWQGWNPDPTMEERHARLPGSGSFYWPNAFRAYLAARDLMRADSTIHQIKIETIGGREIARLYA